MYKKVSGVLTDPFQDFITCAVGRGGGGALGSGADIWFVFTPC